MINKGFLGLAALGVALCGLSSCSSSDDNGGSSVQPANISVGALLDDVTADYQSTITNCLTPGATRAAGTGWNWITEQWGQKHEIPQTMPDEPTVPADAQTVSTVRMDLSHEGNYTVPAGQTIDLTGGSYNFTNSTVYVAGTLKVKEGWGNGTFYVLKGGTLELLGDDEQLVHNVSSKIYNYGTVNKSSNGVYIANSEALYNKGSFNFAGKSFKVQGTLYHEGDLAGCTSYTFQNGCTVNILGNLDMTGLDVPDFEGYVHVGGKVTAKNLTLKGNGFLAADCAVDIAETLDANSTNDLYTDYLHATDVKQSSSSKIYIGENGFVNIDGTYNDQNSGISTWSANPTVSCGIYLTSGPGTHAVVKAAKMQYNSQNVAFLDTHAGGTIAVDCPKYVYWNSTETDDPSFDLAQGGTVQKINNSIDEEQNAQDLKKYYIPAQGCNPGYGTNPGGDTIENVTPVVVSTQHTHDISATCVQSDGNGNVYLSFHKQGAGESGCIEKLTTTNNVTTLDQFVRDHNEQIDINHIMLNGNRLYAVGHTASSKAGSTAGGSGFLGYISLSGGRMNTQDSVIVAQDSTFSYSPLQMVKLQGGDGNAVIYHNNLFKVASTYGLEVFNPDLSEAGSRSTEGKGKHIAIGQDGNAYFSHFTSRSDDTKAPLSLVIEQLDNDDNAATTINGTQVTPNDGKNVICEYDNRIYSAEGVNGLQVYNLDGSKAGEYVLKHTNAAGETLYYAANGVAVDNDYVYVAYGSYGLRVLNRSDLSEVAKFVCGASANYVAYAGTGSNKYIYVAYGKSNIKVLKLVSVTK